MGTTRTSNKDIADKLDTLIGLMIAAQQSETVVKPEPVATPAQPKVETVKVDKAYLNAMVPKWQTLANKNNVSYVGYAYRKSSGKTGLWGCPVDQFQKVSQRENCLGAVIQIDPS